MTHLPQGTGLVWDAKESGMSDNIKNTSIRYAPLSKRIVLARFGKDKTLALETRNATNEFLQVLLQYAFDDGKMPDVGDEAEVTFGAGDEQFVLTVKRVPARREVA